ncbi:MAG: DNA-binding protein [Rhodospirillales bacterium]
MSVISVEEGQLGRIAVVRIKPNEDLCRAVAAAADAEGFTRAYVRGAVGSLVDAALGYGDGHRRDVAGPGVEILTLGGEVRPDADGRPEAFLTGTVSDSEAHVYGGRFLPDANPICITLELVLQEWLAA